MLAYKYRLYRTDKTKILDKMLAEATFVWNHALSLQKRYYSLAQCYGWSHHYIPLTRMQSHFAKRVKRTYMGSQSVQEVLKRLDDGFHIVATRKGKHPPQFKSIRETATIVYKNRGYKIDGNKVTISKVLNNPAYSFKFSKSRDWEGRIMQVVFKHSCGEWFLIIKTDAKPKPYEKVHDGSSVGIDFGIKTYMTLSDGTTISTPPNEILKKVKEYRNRYFSLPRDSPQRKKWRDKELKAYLAYSFNKREWEYKLAHSLCRKYDYIFVESIDMREMIEMQEFKRGRSKAKYLSWGKFLLTLDLVAAKYGVTVHKIDRYYPSSKLCECGYKNSTLHISERVWTCPNCGRQNQRDINAANNIKRRGIAELGL